MTNVVCCLNSMCDCVHMLGAWQLPVWPQELHQLSQPLLCNFVLTTTTIVLHPVITYTSCLSDWAYVCPNSSQMVMTRLLLLSQHCPLWPTARC